MNLMHKLMWIVVACFMMLFVNSAYSQETDSRGNVVQDAAKIPEYALRLIAAYPEQHLRFADNHIIFEDDTAMIYDDGKHKDFEQALDDSDIEDMFLMEYSRSGEPQYLQDAGRSRCESFFKKMYGKDAKSVKKNLVNVLWFGENIKFTRINGAADQLKQVAAEIQQAHPEVIPYMKSSGTFVWRKVRGANRQSSHSYGIAIDIAVKQSDYWRWGYPKAHETDEIRYKNRIPMEIVKVFEKYGFVWGGRWYHYDTMHFEYRPEIVYQKVESQVTGTDYNNR